MKMKKKMVLISLLAASMTLGACGGGGGDPTTPPSPGPGLGKRPAGTKIVIYAGGSSEFSWTAGSEEEDVIDIIEQKYWEETGNSLDFEIGYLGESMRNKLSSELAAGSQVDIAISHTRGGVGIDDFMMQQELYYELTDALYDYAPNLLDAVSKSTMGDDYLGTPLDSLTTWTDEIIGIPSVINPYKFGILVRKDYMEACGYTDDAEKAQTEFEAGKNYELVDNLETFGDMCRAINTITGRNYAVTGASWDWEKALCLGAFSDAGAFTRAVFNLNGQETVMNGGAHESYQAVLDIEYEWATTGVVSKEANSIKLEQGESDFIAGKTGVFVLDPTIEHLIKVARLTKEANPEAEFTVLNALPATRGGTKKGFMRNMEATFGACILKTSKNIVPIMNFLNWVYESEENYNLCRYGVEGEHWIDNGDGTYSFPEGKEEYIMRPAYSGILTLVENQNMSDLVYDGYTEEELHWINDIAANPDNYIQNDVVDYLFAANTQYAAVESSANGLVYGTQVAAWTGATNPASLATGTDLTVFQKKCGDYQSKMSGVHTYYTQQYAAMKAAREARRS